MKKKRLLYIVCGSAIALVFVVLLSVSSAKHGDARTVAMVNGVAISETNDASAIIMKTLLDQFDKSENIVVMPQELEKQREFFEKLAKGTYDQRIAHLNKELENLVGTVDVSNRVAKIKKEIAWLKPSFFVPTDDMLKEDVLLWKRNRALYRRYGGNVYFSHVGGSFPADAYKAFFKEKETEQAFEIFDGKLRKDFWDELTSDAQQSELLLDDGKKAIETPPWEMTIAE